MDAVDHNTCPTTTTSDSAGRTRVGATHPIRLVAIDLDGTLLTDSKEITRQTADALRCLPARGVRVVIASARPPRSVRPFQEQLGLDTLQINYNGALIWDPAQQRAVFHVPMHPRLCRGMIDNARDMFDEVLVSVECMDKWYTDRVDQTYTTETGRLFKPDLVCPVDDFCNQPITKLMLLGDPKMILRLEDLLTIRYGHIASILRCEPELLQIMDGRVSKAIALEKIADHYGIPMEEVMAIGDARNDVEMLDMAGVAVAMDNAHPLVKEVADWVAPSNNDHGVHAALVRYGLCS
jgi:hypothetical protein